MAGSATAIRDRGISVTTWGVRCHGNTFVADNSHLWCAEIMAWKVGREAARLAKEESKLMPEPKEVWVETRKGLQMYGCMEIVICMYFVGMYVDYL